MMASTERAHHETPRTAGRSGRLSEWAQHRLALVCDPRFTGGTSASVAADIRALGRHMRLSVVAIETAMFKGRRVHPAIEAALEEAGVVAELEPVGGPRRYDRLPEPVLPAIRHRANGPIELRAGVRRDPRELPRSERLGGARRQRRVWTSSRLRSSAAPATWRPFRPTTAAPWRRGLPGSSRLAAGGGRLAVVFDPELTPPTRAPRDRRGRHSRPGLEKFPPIDTMLAHFPAHAERCAILGGDTFLLDRRDAPAHWEVLRFGEADVADFLSGIDFFVYFTHPIWRESFGRVIVEAIAAGKVVITDPGTAATFGEAVVASDGGDVDRIIQGFIADPQRYVAFVEAAQARLSEHRPAAFVERVESLIIRGQAGRPMIWCETGRSDARAIEHLAVFVSQLNALGLRAGMDVRAVPAGLHRTVRFDIAPYLLEGPIEPEDRSRSSPRASLPTRSWWSFGVSAAASPRRASPSAASRAVRS